MTPTSSRSVFLALAVLLAGTAAHAQSLQVGFADHDALLESMPDYQQAQQEAQGLAQQNTERLESLFTDLQDRVERYVRQQPLLSDETRREREAELARYEQEFREAERDGNARLAARQDELLRPVYARLENAIGAVARERGLHLVLRKQAGAAVPVVLYRDDRLIADVTSDVARRLGVELGSVGTH